MSRITGGSEREPRDMWRLSIFLFAASDSKPTGASAVSNAHFGQGSNNILLDQVSCSGNELRLFDCTANPIGDHDCSNSEDAGVVCNISGRNTFQCPHSEG